MKQMTFFRFWEYDIDTGTVMARCPECSRRIPMGVYAPHNPYKYCPYCGIALEEGKYKQAKERRDSE